MKRGWKRRPAEVDNPHKVMMQVVERKWYHQSRGKTRNERMVSIVSDKNARPLSYMIIHFGFLVSFIRGGGTAP